VKDHGAEKVALLPGAERARIEAALRGWPRRGVAFYARMTGLTAERVEEILEQMEAEGVVDSAPMLEGVKST
jgi:hypothetical protein